MGSRPIFRIIIGILWPGLQLIPFSFYEQLINPITISIFILFSTSEHFLSRAYSGRIFLCWRPEFYYLISVAPFVVSFFWGANLHCFLLLVCHLWFLGTQEKNRQAVSLSGAH